MQGMQSQLELRPLVRTTGQSLLLRLTGFTANRKENTDTVSDRSQGGSCVSTTQSIPAAHIQ